MKKIIHVLAGFVGGIAFLISCGGGGGGEPTSVVPIQTVNADTVIVSQMFCSKAGGLIFRNSTPFGGDPNTPFPETLFCLDSAGSTAKLSIQSAYQQGWKIQQINQDEVVFYK